MTKVFILCSGLGYKKRGFESFTQECFDALSQNASLDITLFKGCGKNYKKEIALWNLPYNAQITNEISKVFKTPYRRDPYFLQQFSFFISLLPHIHLKNPELIYFSEPVLGTLLLQWRRFTKQNYKLLFSNGGPCKPTVFYRWDHVQQLTPSHLREALDVGVPAEKQSLVPYGINMPSELHILAASEREALRHRLGLPEKRPLILSVGSIRKFHKRMDYVVREIASMPEPRPYLLLLGQQELDSQEILQLGNTLLGIDNFQIRTVEQNQVADYYMLADAFVLASLHEGFGRVFLEAMAYGLPCLAHDYEVTRFILEEAYLSNFELTGSLASLVPQALAESSDVSKRYVRHRAVYERFSWEKLRPDYAKLIQKCAMVNVSNPISPRSPIPNQGL